jgi:hypothetical protein
VAVRGQPEHADPIRKRNSAMDSPEQWQFSPIPT